jgi:hypothetical protein
MNPADEMAAEDAAGSGEKSDQQLRAILENLRRVNPVEQDDLRSGIADRETSERRAIYSRLVAIENEMKRRGSRGFARYLVAILIGVAATLAWQSYGEATKQIIATRAPELGWSPETKQMIASWVQQFGWTKPPAGPEKTAAETVAPKAATATPLDPAQVQQMAQNLAAVRETIQELAASQDQIRREIGKLESAVVEILVKIPEPPPQPPAAAARKPVSPPSSRAPVAPPSSRAPVPPRQ